jgi:ATP-dependent DNA helicase HFM1/MER3
MILLVFFNIVCFSGGTWQICFAPSKALVQEKLLDWNKKLGSIGIKCLEMTGDNELYNNKSIQDADIILTAPEVYVTTCFSMCELK